MEAGGTGRPGREPGFEADLERVETAARSGPIDLGPAGFWQLVGRVKADPRLVEAYADRLGALDTQAFRSRVRPRVPVWAGNLVLVAGILVGCTLVAFALDGATPGWAAVALISAALCWAVSFHCPSHWIVGRLIGIGFTDYFLGGPPPPRPGLKTNLASYLRAAPRGRAWMHASGALATKAAPFLALAFWPASGAPGWCALALLAIGGFQIATDLLFSVRSSDWMKFRREMAFAKASEGSSG